MPSLAGQNGVQRDIGICKLIRERRCCFVGSELVEIQQVPQPPEDSADVETERVFNKPIWTDFLPLHPESFGYLCYAATVFRLLEAVDNSAVDIANPDLLLFCSPLLLNSKDLFFLTSDETKLRSHDGPRSFRIGAAHVYYELWLRDHLVRLHRSAVR